MGIEPLSGIREAASPRPTRGLGDAPAGGKAEGEGKAGEAPEGQGGAILRLQTFRHRRIDARCAGKAPDSQKLQIVKSSR